MNTIVSVLKRVSSSEPLNKEYKIYMDSLPQKLRHHRLIKDWFLSQKPTNELTKSLSAVILEPPQIKFVSISIASPPICHDMMEPDAMI